MEMHFADIPNNRYDTNKYIVTDKNKFAKTKYKQNEPENQNRIFNFCILSHLIIHWLNNLINYSMLFFGFVMNREFLPSHCIYHTNSQSEEEPKIIKNNKMQNKYEKKVQFEF